MNKQLNKKICGGMCVVEPLGYNNHAALCSFENLCVVFFVGYSCGKSHSHAVKTHYQHLRCTILSVIMRCLFETSTGPRDSEFWPFLSEMWILVALARQYFPQIRCSFLDLRVLTVRTDRRTDGVHHSIIRLLRSSPPIYGRSYSEKC